MSGFEELVTAMLRQIAPHAHEDFVLCGHSLGGLLAFEIARQLRDRGAGTPRALVVCGTRAPGTGYREAVLHNLPRDEFIAAVELRYGALPEEIRALPKFLDVLLPAIRADLKAYETYRYASSSPLNIPVLALGGECDDIVSQTDILDWQQHTTGRFEAGFMPGSHFFPQREMNATTGRVKIFLRSLLA